MPRARRRYTATEKADAVADAERTSLTQASESSGIPITTLKYWYDHPDFAEVRTKTRENLEEGSVVMAVIAQGEIIRRIRAGTISDQALVAAYGVGIDKAQLLGGNATSRMETRDLTGTLEDSDIRDAVREAVRLTGSGDAGASAPAEGPPEG